MNPNLYRACPICGSAAGQPLRSMRFVLPENHPLQAGYEVVACARCGFVFADVRASQADYDRFYAECSKYDNVSTGTGGGGTPEDAVRLRETAMDIARLEPNRDVAILDVGCATGGLLEALKECGFTHLLGLDPSPASEVYARDHFGLTVKTGSLFGDSGLEPQDGVILSHVLEHVLDLEGAAAALRRLVKPRGWLYVEVPDARRYKDEEFLVAPFQDFNTEHINHFSLPTLDLLLKRAGFSLKHQGEKTMMAAPKSPYPAIWGWWIAEDVEAPVGKMTRDEELVGDIQTYIQNSQAILDGYDAIIHAATSDGQPVAVWGTGQLSLRLLTETSLKDANLSCFVDGNPDKQGKRLFNLPVLAPESLAGRTDKILVASTIHQAAIARRIREQMKLSNPLILLRPEGAS